MEKLRVLKNAENQSDCSGSEEKNYWVVMSDSFIMEMKGDAWMRFWSGCDDGKPELKVISVDINTDKEIR
jgi:hypothetical protein